MFKESVVYNDKNLTFASEQVAYFEADYGGTEIYKPLDDIFTKIK